MVANRSLLAIAFLLVLLAGSLEARPRTIVLSILVPEDSPSPSNTGPYGSSRLFEGLRDLGFNVAIAPQARDLESLDFEGKRVALLVLGSDYFSRKAADSLLRALRYIASPSSGAGGVAVIVADEAPGEAMLGFIEGVSRELCRGHYFTLVPGRPEAASTIALLEPGGDAVTGEAGVAGVVAGLGIEARNFLAIAALAAVRGGGASSAELGGSEARVIAYAFPSPLDGSPVPVPAGVACRGERGALILLADSSMLLNGSEANVDAGRALLSWAFPGADPQEVVVVTVQEAYLGEGPARDIAVRVHPSVVMVALAQALPELERGLAASIRSVEILSLGFLASTTLLLAALSGGGREGLFPERGVRGVNRAWSLKRIYQGVLAGWPRVKRLLRRRPLGPSQ